MIEEAKIILEAVVVALEAPNDACFHFKSHCLARRKAPANDGIRRQSISSQFYVCYRHSGRVGNSIRNCPPGAKAAKVNGLSSYSFRPAREAASRTKLPSTHRVAKTIRGPSSSSKRARAAVALAPLECSLTASISWWRSSKRARRRLCSATPSGCSLRALNATRSKISMAHRH